MTIEIKEAPHSKENEMMVLGCMLTNEHGLKIAADGLCDSDFYCTEHKSIFNTLKSLHGDKRPADIHLVGEDLKKHGKLESIGGLAYITTLAQYAGTSAYVEEYIDSLKEDSKRRQLLALAKTIERNAFEENNVAKVIIETQEELSRIEKNKGSKEKFQIKFLNQFDKNFLTVNPPKKQMLLEYANDKGSPIGFLPKGVVGMLVGAGGVGKTHLLSQLAIAVSTGTLWLDTFTTTEHCGKGRKGSVFLGLGENQYDDIHRLLHKASQKLKNHQPDLTKEDPLIEASKRIAPFSFCGQQAAFIEGGKPSLYFRQLKARLIEETPKDGWSLIILDPVSRLMGANAEIDNAAATQFIALLEELTIDLPGNPTVLFAHHVNKASMKTGGNQDQTAARGASALTDGVRWQCNLSKIDDKLIVLTMPKSNFTHMPDTIELMKNKEGYLEKTNSNGNKVETEQKNKKSPTKY